MKLLIYKPVRRRSSACSPGISAQRLFDRVWAKIDDEEPPERDHGGATWPKVLAAAALQG